MSDVQSNRNDKKERGRKRTREGSSQTDEEDATENHICRQSCEQCKDSTNERLISIEEKLNMLLVVLPELENYKSRINQLEEENKSLQTSLQNAQTEIEDLKALVNGVDSQQRNTNTAQERIEKELNELRRRHVKLECHSRRGNLKFFGLKERENESNSDTEAVLREFMRTKLKILPSDEKQIQFDRVHRISTRSRDGRNSEPRPIIVKLSVFQDKNFIKFFIRTFPKDPTLEYLTIFPKKLTRSERSYTLFSKRPNAKRKKLTSTLKSYLSTAHSTGDLKHLSSHFTDV